MATDVGLCNGMAFAILQSMFELQPSAPLDSLALPPPDQFAEVSLLLPRWQVQVLDAAAEARGVTAGQLVRRLLAEALPPFASASTLP